ncbi:MAG: 4Fe-4S binding protein [Candidatus Wallbacteria bacterium]|nr:4Fe-4S binding protein [Candidatus Wallbacteria bacterium]
MALESSPAQVLRRMTQAAFVLLAAGAGLGLAMGWLSGGVERFCPFGGIETLWSVATQQRFTCATGPYNLTLMIALVAATVVVRKAFCSWICPVGTVSEWLGMLARRLRRRRRSDALGLLEPPPRADTALRGLRLAVLAAVVLATVGTGELAFRPYDPYYVIFSFNGHEVQWWSYPLVASLLALAIVVPMAWCRYLCPLGCVLWPFSRFGWLRVRRLAEACSDCGRCDRVCPHGLEISKVDEVRSGECTLCLECTRVCGRRQALTLAPAGSLRRLPGWSLALVLAIAIAFGLGTARRVAFASYQRTYSNAPARSPSTAVFTVDGVRCVDTATLAASQLDELEGVLSLEAHASDHILRVTYDALSVDPAAIREAFESPVYDASSGAFLFNVFHVRDVTVVPAPLRGPARKDEP